MWHYRYLLYQLNSFIRTHRSVPCCPDLAWGGRTIHHATVGRASTTREASYIVQPVEVKLRKADKVNGLWAVGEILAVA